MRSPGRATPARPTRDRLRRAAAVLVACAACWLTGRAQAHPVGFSSLYAELEDTTVSVSLDLHPLTLIDVLPGVDTDQDRRLSEGEATASRSALESYLDRTLVVRSDGTPCSAAPLEAPRLVGGERLLARRRFACAKRPAVLGWEVRIFQEDEGGHQVMGRIRTPATYDQFVFQGGQELRDVPAVARPGAPPAAVSGSTPAPAAQRGRGEVFVSFLGSGVEHILLGFDHVLFVVLLVFGVRSLRELVKVITAFTLAHSVTLALGALDLVRVPSRWVESAIALSIAWLAVENVLVAAPRHRAKLTFAFGLIHGLGLSAALRELGLDATDATVPLVAFNLGVEAGQLALVAPLQPLLAWLRREPRRDRWSLLVSSGVVGSLGVLWFVDRAFDLGLMPF
ncbi:MAG: HupE/UreJ family protein [Polyangiaceae bacterium]|nr:HupE/UreJ family protein [Polyangiaceae bacterium]